MTIQVTRWSPDTCQCVFEYEWDDSVLLANRVHTFKKAIITCPSHSATLGLFPVVLEENQRKNKVLGYLLDIKNTANIKLGDPEDDTPDQAAWRVAQTVIIKNYKWQFDVNRILKADFGSVMLAKDKTALVTALKTVNLDKLVQVE